MKYVTALGTALSVGISYNGSIDLYLIGRNGRLTRTHDYQT